MAQTAPLDAFHRTSESPGYVELRQVSKVFGQDIAVQSINLEIKQGEFFSILGPSGCGKTTTLRLIAGFETPTRGEIWIQNQPMTQIPAYQRPVNTVFQSYALFGHMTVRDNVAFGLRVKRLSQREVQKRVQDALQLVKMTDFAQRFPQQLSGGQQQRVALARALVNRPAVLLLDEPLGALDLKLRKEMQMELSNLHQELGVTTVMVTHDQEEALSLSDRIAVMNAGTIEQIGTPTQIYDSPQTAFVADFIGDANLFQGRVMGSENSLALVVTSNGLSITVQSAIEGGISVDQPVCISVRPEKVRLSLEPPNLDHNCFQGRLKTVMYRGTHVHCVIQLESGDLLTVHQSSKLAQHMEKLPDSETPIYTYWSATDCLALAS